MVFLLHTDSSEGLHCVHEEQLFTKDISVVLVVFVVVCLNIIYLHIQYLIIF